MRSVNLQDRHPKHVRAVALTAAYEDVFPQDRERGIENVNVVQPIALSREIGELGRGLVSDPNAREGVILHGSRFDGNCRGMQRENSVARPRDNEAKNGGLMNQPATSVRNHCLSPARARVAIDAPIGPANGMLAARNSTLNACTATDQPAIRSSTNSTTQRSSCSAWTEQTSNEMQRASHLSATRATTRTC